MSTPWAQPIARPGSASMFLWLPQGGLLYDCLALVKRATNLGKARIGQVTTESYHDIVTPAVREFVQLCERSDFRTAQ